MTLIEVLGAVLLFIILLPIIFLLNFIIIIGGLRVFGEWLEHVIDRVRDNDAKKRKRK